MTSTEQKAQRAPTAKELAEQAVAMAEQANSTSSQVLAELRDLREGGLPVAAASGSVDASVTERLDLLDKDIEGLIENLNTVSARIKDPMGPDGKPIDLATLVVDIQKTFKAHAAKIDENNEATRKALGAAGQLDATGANILTDLGAKLVELKERVDLFDESGAAPASAEDLSSLDDRLKRVEGHLGADGLGGADRAVQVIDMHGDQVPAIHRQIWQLMNTVESLGKDSQAAQNMGGYKFRSIDGAMDAVGRALRQVGVMFVPGEILDKRVERYTTEGNEWKNGTKYTKTLNWTHVWVTQRYYFVSLIDGSRSEPFEMDSEARDNGDKSTSKADSMRMKYALLQALCIPINGLPESDGRDGTENADWGSAPPVGSGQGQQRQQAQRAPEDEPPWDDTPSAPPQDAAPDQPPVDNRTDEEKALAVVKALRDVMQAPREERRARFTKIATAVGQQRLGSLMVEGMSINAHLTATNSNLGT